MRGLRYEKVKARPNFEPDDPRNRKMTTEVRPKMAHNDDATLGGKVRMTGEMEGVQNVELKRRKVDKRMIGRPTNFRLVN